MIPDRLPLKTANRYADAISLFFWVSVFTLIVYMKMAAFVFALLFSMFVLNLVYESLIRINIRHKALASLISSIIIATLIYLVFKSFSFLLKDLTVFLIESEAVINKTLKELGIQETFIHNISDLYKWVAEQLTANLGVVKNVGVTMLKVILGIVFGLIIFHHSITPMEEEESLWNLAEYKIYNFSYQIFNSFRSIMVTQVLISLMNTITISIFAMIITRLYSGEFLPYWYIIIPLVTIFSLIPVIGNLMVNVLIGVAALQVSMHYIIITIGYFFIVHKMELFVIGKVLHKRMKVAFVLILFSMIIGELIFSSMVGVILGMVMLFVLLSTLKSYKIDFVSEEEKEELPNLKKMDMTRM